ncbi:hypothetical protein, partial [Alistipes putredinis]|uniref:hypothetical protein n=2 Tax=Alistipes putredinis TaxID=28117 RepID=UPI003AB4F978
QDKNNAFLAYRFSHSIHNPSQKIHYRPKKSIPYRFPTQSPTCKHSVRNPSERPFCPQLRREIRPGQNNLRSIANKFGTARGFCYLCI